MNCGCGLGLFLGWFIGLVDRELREARWESSARELRAEARAVASWEPGCAPAARPSRGGRPKARPSPSSSTSSVDPARREPPLLGCSRFPLLECVNVAGLFCQSQGCCASGIAQKVCCDRLARTGVALCSECWSRYLAEANAEQPKTIEAAFFLRAYELSRPPEELFAQSPSGSSTGRRT